MREREQDREWKEDKREIREIVLKRYKERPLCEKEKRTDNERKDNAEKIYRKRSYNERERERGGDRERKENK